MLGVAVVPGIAVVGVLVVLAVMVAVVSGLAVGVALVVVIVVVSRLAVAVGVPVGIAIVLGVAVGLVSDGVGHVLDVFNMSYRGNMLNDSLNNGSSHGLNNGGRGHGNGGRSRNVSHGSGVEESRGGELLLVESGVHDELLLGKDLGSGESGRDRLGNGHLGSSTHEGRLGSSLDKGGLGKGNRGGNGGTNGIDESVHVNILRESLEGNGPEATLGGDESISGHGGNGARGGTLVDVGIGHASHNGSSLSEDGHLGLALGGDEEGGEDCLQV